MRTYIAILLIAIMLLGCNTRTTSTTVVEDDEHAEVVDISTGESKGRAVFTITDAAANLGAVSQILVTIDSVEAYNADDGWVTVMGDEETYDILALKAAGEHAVLADVLVDAGTYTQMRLDISSIVIVDEDGRHDAELPSEKYTVTADLVVENGGTSTATFDFLADQSLHTTENGEYVFAPVVNVETRTDAAIESRGGNRVVIVGGTIVSDVVYGMNLAGEVGVNVVIPDVVLVVDNGILTTRTNERVVNNYYNTTTIIERERIVYRDSGDSRNTTARANTTVNGTA